MTVNYETGEIVEAPSFGAVKDSIGRAKASLEEAAKEIVWQVENQAWAVLGYVDWNEMREAEYGGAAFMVPKAERPELHARMKRAGMTNADIAATSGVSDETVRRDLQPTNVGSDEADKPATITNTRGQQRPTSYNTRPTPPPAPTVDEAVREFPDLAYYVEDHARVINMAADLRRYRERGELDERLATLRRSIEIDKSKRDGTYTPSPMPTARTCPTCNGRGVIQE